MAETSFIVGDIFGEKLYQERARRALPVLVRQALSGKPITYEGLALELGMPNPRNLNWVLGSVGHSLYELSRKRGWKKRAPPHIQSLVINKGTQMPGPGFDSFLAGRDVDYGKLDKQQKRLYLNGYWVDVFAYPYWREVLSEFDLVAGKDDRSQVIAKAKTGRGNGGGEGPEHKALKDLIIRYPNLAGIDSAAVGSLEQPLPSGDRLDVLFVSGADKFAVEVKSSISNDADIARGLFQCVKYKAVMEAERGFLSETYLVDVRLVLGKQFPSALVPLRNSLGVTVVSVAG